MYSLNPWLHEKLTQVVIDGLRREAGPSNSLSADQLRSWSGELKTALRSRNKESDSLPLDDLDKIVFADNLGKADTELKEVGNYLGGSGAQIWMSDSLLYDLASCIARVHLISHCFGDYREKEASRVLSSSPP